ncbi:Uncharacterized protein M6B38_209680 [Iris pallida]|uniref:soluble epoxide hydrolase n=1 Tax=Iris pallida TaxID=29817 RepID=A0AAX6E356_IRIPA|nr:Uncharacterized protein M6B38_209680 [Iris pallida]
MDGIVHRNVEVNGIRMHVAEKGEGPAVVLLLHGFPELWYSWRHQIQGLAQRGYRAVAPDLRGYGDTDAPPSVSDYSIFHIVGDVVALIDSLGQDQVYVVGHDWGALVAWNLCMFRPDKVKALVNLSVAYRPWHQTANPVEYFSSIYGDDYYVSRFQEHGAVEAGFDRVGVNTLFKMILTSRNPGPFMLQKDHDFGLPPNTQITLPSWVTEEDISYFTSKYEKTGFTNPINYYRNLEQNWKLTEPWRGIQIKVPTKFIIGDLDMTYHYPDVQDYIHKGGFKKDVPLLEEVVVMPDVAHFINQEKAREVTDHILEFIQKF